MSSVSEVTDDTKVWRYMTFSRFMWALMKQQLWMARIDLLSDDFEMVPSQSQRTLYFESLQGEDLTAAQKNARINENLQSYRERMFVNCWFASEHESDLMWNRYCGTVEGVALETTLGKLKRALPTVRPVSYAEPPPSKIFPTMFELATQKRPEFRDEREVRSLLFWEQPYSGNPFLGIPITFEFETALDYVRVKGDFVFWETVAGALERFAPKLAHFVPYSKLQHKSGF